MPMPVSATLISMCEFTRASTTWTLPPAGVNLIALESRFQTTCCRRPGSPEIGPACGSSTFSSRMRLASARRPHGLERRLDEGRRLHRLHVEAHLAGGDAGHVEQVLDQLGLRARVALDHLHRPQQLLALHAAGGDDLRPAEDRAERRAQLVRQRGEELVLELAHALGLGARGALAVLRLLAAR